MEDHLLGAYGMCTGYNNATACQLLTNMCTLLYARQLNFGDGQLINDACSLLNRAVSSFKPELWTANSVLTNNYLASRVLYSRNALVDIVVAIYAMNGTFVELRSVQDGIIQLCPDKFSSLNAAYRFSTAYSQQCTISRDSLPERLKNVFFDPCKSIVFTPQFFIRMTEI